MIIVFQVHVPNGDVVIGAGVPLNTLIKFLEDQATVVSGYKVLADHVRKVKVDCTSKNMRRLDGAPPGFRVAS